jgi:hypothetical protein
MRESNVNYDLSTPEGMKNAIEWQKKLVAAVNPGGVWIVPRSLSVYQIQHDERIAVKTCGDAEPDINKVFQAMGWTVIETDPRAGAESC